MTTLSAIRPLASDLFLRSVLEQDGFRFRSPAPGRLECRHVGRLNGMPTPADLAIVKRFKAAILATFNG